eukprot:Cvel_27566.t1-p1 / transcript=Cvel_27566.t1 / gene=Cvel_27566 / organism=Chromera_velia_CCMP2878 / gene_product=hypothetical protein / transcript_product=hypothetical protein / location=Cvel_scaffold3463:1-1751(-) / protein_length=263 / sequence_SO=supercontig / SO=protein_coding / is_pseudo=false
MLKGVPETTVLKDFQKWTDKNPSSEYPKVFVRTAQRLAFMEFEDDESANEFYTDYRNGGLEIGGENVSVEWSRRTGVETQKEINDKLAKSKTCRCVLVHVMAVKSEFNVARVKELFTPCGTLVRAAMWKDDHHPDVQKMCVEFEDPDGAARAVEELDEKQLHPNGDLLRVSFSLKEGLVVTANSHHKIDFTRPTLPTALPSSRLRQGHHPENGLSQAAAGGGARSSRAHIQRGQMTSGGGAALHSHSQLDGQPPPPPPTLPPP